MSGGDQECIFFTLNKYQPTFISDTLSTPTGIENSKVGCDDTGVTRPYGRTDVKVEIVM